MPAHTEVPLIDPDLLRLLCCPACSSRPPLFAEGDVLVCKSCRRSYPVDNGLPDLVVKNANAGE